MQTLKKQAHFRVRVKSVAALKPRYFSARLPKWFFYLSSSYLVETSPKQMYTFSYFSFSDFKRPQPSCYDR
jgi:hypothetical protein